MSELANSSWGPALFLVVIPYCVFEVLGYVLRRVNALFRLLDWAEWHEQQAREYADVGMEAYGLSHAYHAKQYRLQAKRWYLPWRDLWSPDPRGRY